jgi:hypothetical protein
MSNCAPFFFNLAISLFTDLLFVFTISIFGHERVADLPFFEEPQLTKKNPKIKAAKKERQKKCLNRTNEMLRDMCYWFAVFKSQCY